jgi:hypothetical protein
MDFLLETNIPQYLDNFNNNYTWAPTTHYFCWSTNENNEFILWNLGSIWMKILNDIVCQLWIEFKYIEWNSNPT